jgi:2-polyprenyl-3-methyl-5-hydroxy-6-metoxy-1,4-benzoquinol methylase
MNEFDSRNFKARDASSYDTVTEQFDYFTQRLSQPMALHLLSLADIAPSEKILDVGTGTGVVALEAAKIIDGRGEIHGIDLSSEMLAKAEEKALRAGFDQRINFSLMDIEALNFAEHQFNVVLSLFALLHFPNPKTALEEIYRVIRPGGRLILAVGSGIPMFSFYSWIHLVRRFPDFLKDLLGRRLTAPQFLDSLVLQNIPETHEPEESHLAAHTFHNRARTVVSLIKEVGFKVLKTDWLGHEEIIETPEEFWEIQRTFSSIARKRLSIADANQIENIQRKFLKKCREVQSKGGQLVYPFGAFYVVAMRD